MADITNDTAFLAIDIQNDFCPGGALAVPDGDRIVTLVNRLFPRFPIRILTQDWHPANHQSFASNNPGGTAFSTVEKPYGTQVLWPDHCIQNTHGSAFHPELETRYAHAVIRKGFRPEIDSYSAFFENDDRTPTGLHGYLTELGVSKVVLSGLATDFCVGDSAMDAARLGYSVTVIEDACKAIDLDGSLDVARTRMRDAGVEFSGSGAYLG